MSEIALVTARKSKLEADSKKGNFTARKALHIIQHPDSFLSTVQIGITLVGILTGVFSGEALTAKINLLLQNIPFLAPWSGSIALTIVVLIVTYFTLVLGELVPKRIAMAYPEKIATKVSGIMNILSKLTTPFVWLLSSSTRLILRLLNVKSNDENKVTEEEILAVIQEGIDDGEIEEGEQDMVERVFDLSDRTVVSIMTNRNDLVWIDANKPLDEIRPLIKEELHDVYPVCRGSLDDVIGVAYLKDMFDTIHKPEAAIEQWLRPAQFVPETMNAYRVLELFKETKVHYTLVTDEYGSVQGMLTMLDILDAIVGNVVDDHEDDDQIIKREDNTYLVDGQYSFYDFLAYFDMEDRFEEHDYNTLSGLILDVLKRIPHTGEKLEWTEFGFEIVDMDGVRIDKVLVTRYEESVEKPEKPEEVTPPEN